jgi:hypothetical protein
LQLGTPKTTFGGFFITAFFAELKLRIDRVTMQMMENIWREIEYRLDILHAWKGAHVEVV